MKYKRAIKGWVGILGIVLFFICAYHSYMQGGNTLLIILGFVSLAVGTAMLSDRD